MRIAICDDELLAARQLERIVKKILERETGRTAAATEEMEKEPRTDVGVSENPQVRIFTSGEILLGEIHQFDVVFLDLRMPRMDGIDVGKEILRRISIRISNTEIILWTEISARISSEKFARVFWEISQNRRI